MPQAEDDSDLSDRSLGEDDDMAAREAHPNRFKETEGSVRSSSNGSRKEKARDGRKRNVHEWFRRHSTCEKETEGRQDRRCVGQSIGEKA